MKNIFFTLFVIVSVIYLFNPGIYAQETHKIKIYVDKKDNFIKTDADVIEVQRGDSVTFYTDDANQYMVLIYNVNRFFDLDSDILRFSVDKSHARTYIIGTPEDSDSADIYPITIVNLLDPEPIPTAPPRIVLVGSSVERD